MKVVLLHGYGEDSTVWQEFIKLLDPKNEYITPDFSRKKDCFSIPEYADWLKKEFDKLKIENAVIIGHSMGGYISLEFASNYPEKVIGLGLFHSSAAADSEEKKEARDKTIQFLIKHDTDYYIKHFYPNMFSEEFRTKKKKLLEENIERFSKIPNEALLAATLAMKGRGSHIETLPKLKFPVFNIIGKLDTFVNPNDVLIQANVPLKPSILLLHEVAHAGMFENPSMCSLFINDFLSKIA